MSLPLEIKIKYLECPEVEAFLPYERTSVFAGGKVYVSDRTVQRMNMLQADNAAIIVRLWLINMLPEKCSE